MAEENTSTHAQQAQNDNQEVCTLCIMLFVESKPFRER